MNLCNKSEQLYTDFMMHIFINSKKTRSTKLKKKFLVNAFILTVTSLILSTIGITFRVYVSNKIGPEGLGLYQLIFSVYTFALTFATSGISLAVTRLVAEEKTIGSHSTVKSVLRKIFALSIMLSLIACFALFFFSDFFGVKFLGDYRTILGLKLLSFSLLFIGISSCLRGYFNALREVIKPASAQILEQISEIIIVVNIINHFLPKGLEYAVAAIILGTTVSEIISCMYMFLLYCLEERKYKSNPYKSTNLKIIRNNGTKMIRRHGVLKRILSISLPIAVSSYIRSALKTIENILIPTGLKKYGTTNKFALEQYGMLTGMALPILNFPSVFLSSYSALLVPEIAEANTKGHKKRVNYTISRVFQMTSLLSILITGVIMLFSAELGMAIYNNQEISTMLRMLAPLIPIMYLDTVADGMLKGLDQQMSTMTINIIDSILRVAMIYYLIPAKGVTGLIIVIIVSNIMDSLLSIGRLLKVTGLRFRIIDWAVKPFLAVTASCIMVSFLFKFFINMEYFSIGMNIAIGALLVSLIYFILLLSLDCLKEEDILWFINIFRNSKQLPTNTWHKWGQV